MKRFTLIVFAFLMISGLWAQNLSVVKVEALTTLDQGMFYFPKLTPDGTAVLFTGPRYTGLYLLNLGETKIKKLTDEAGAGYEYSLSPDGKKVIFRVFEMKNFRKFYTLKELNLQDGAQRELEKEVRTLSPPAVFKGKLVYLKDQTVKTQLLIPSTLQSKDNSEKAVFIRNRTIILIEDGIQKELQPLGEGIYIWPRLSPDGQRIVFTKAGEGTFVCDLQGNILTDLGYANAPVWSPDGKWIAYMVDHDDGHRYTDSEIFVVPANGGSPVQITNTSNVIEMYPNWDGKITQLVFASDQGQIFLATLKIE